MKILIINEKIIEGGAEQSCLKMKKLLEEHNNNVHYLTFDNNFEKKIQNLEDTNNIINIRVKNNLINKMIFKPILYLKIRRRIKEIRPDKIILNNLFCSPITQLKALKGYEVYQIVRDFSIVCPKSTSIKKNFDICKGYKRENCMKNCDYHNTKLKLKFKLYLTRRLEKVRKQIVKKIISPSENLNKYLLNFGYNSCCVNNPMKIENKELPNKNFDKKYREYIYVGMINKNKGIYDFLDSFKYFEVQKDVKLKIIGKPSSKEDEETLKKYIKDDLKIEFLGYKNHNDTILEIEKADFIVVPSLWIENYPTTALEGMLYGAVVLGSNRGGIPEIVGKDRGFLFDITEKKDILQTLDKSYNLDYNSYCEVRDRANKYVKDNNSFKTYYKKIMKILED